MWKSKIIADRQIAADFLRNFASESKSKHYLLRDRRKKVMQSLLALDYVSPPEAAQIQLHSDTAKINFWYYLFYQNLHIFENLGKSMREAVWRIIAAQLAAAPQHWLGSLNNILDAVQQRKLNPFLEEVRLTRFIQESPFNYFTVPLYRHYSALTADKQKSFCRDAAAAQQAILADLPYSAVKKMLPRWGFLPESRRAFDLLLQVMPWQTAFPQNNLQRIYRIFRRNTGRDFTLRGQLAAEFPILSGQVLRRGEHYYRLGKSAWHIPFGGLADICTAHRPEILWLCPEFNLISIYDAKNYLGFLMTLFLSVPEHGKYLVLYGSEPTASFVKGQDTAALYQEFISVCQEYAAMTGLSGAGQTDCPAWHSNRPQLRDHIKNRIAVLPKLNLAANYVDYWGYQSSGIYLFP
ncbi:MAG: hypothetical protein LBK68_00140 [Candidatus Margulisbacteria bacterium]|jgi:hypothetical protein|nr:hypothetical protein [Candidatus Margulisiibacteriota bacterium]